MPPMLTRTAFVHSACLLALVACAKQGAEEDGNSSSGGTSSIFSGGSGSGVSTGPGSSAGAAYSTAVGPNGTVVHWAEETPEGLSAALDPTKVADLITNPDSACSGWVSEPESAGSVLEFVVDVSGSMGLTAPTTGGATKWGVTKQALASAMNSMPDTVAVGMTFFPNMAIQASTFPRAASACVNTKSDVAIAPMDAAHKQQIVAALNGIQINSMGATPTHDAYNIALADLKTSAAPGDKYLALITDGQPTQSLGCIGNGMTCTPEPTQPVVDAITLARQDDHIRTFIVGSPGSEKNDCTQADSRSWLSAAARAGDSAAAGCNDSGPSYCHFDETQQPDFGTALTSALDAIISGVIACDYDVPSAPDGRKLDLAHINLIFGQGDGSQVLVLPSSQENCTLGWHFTDASQTRLHVCSKTCERLQGDYHATLTLLFGCAASDINPLL